MTGLVAQEAWLLSLAEPALPPGWTPHTRREKVGWGGTSKEKQGHAAGCSPTAQALLGTGWRDGGDGDGFGEREELSWGRWVL